jgi:hypothetical protein
VGVVVLWELGVATSTISYIRPVIDSLLGRRGVPAGHKKGLAGTIPFPDTVMEYLSTLVLVIVAPLGAWKVWSARRREQNSMALGLALGALSIFMVIGIRVLATDGSELSGRLMTFALIPVSFVSAILIAGAVRKRRDNRIGHQRFWNIGMTIVGTGTVIVLAVGGIAGGSPNYYARLPGPYLVSAFERSVDDHNLDAAAWAADKLPPDDGVASDSFTAAMFSSLGHQAYVPGVAELFLSQQYTNADRRLAKKKKISYVVVDKRITEQLPAAGNYFSPDPHQNTYKKPLSPSMVDKFNHVPGVSRIFDDGTIVIYDLEGSAQ